MRYSLTSGTTQHPCGYFTPHLSHSFAVTTPLTKLSDATRKIRTGLQPAGNTDSTCPVLQPSLLRGSETNKIQYNPAQESVNRFLKVFDICALQNTPTFVVNSCVHQGILRPCRLRLISNGAVSSKSNHCLLCRPIVYRSGCQPKTPRTLPERTQGNSTKNGAPQLPHDNRATHTTTPKITCPPVPL